MKNEFGLPLTSIGGKVIWCFQGEECVLDRGYARLEGSLIEEIKEFLDIQFDSDFLGIFRIDNMNKEDILGYRLNEFNYQLIEDKKGYEFRVQIFHNKKVKVAYLYFGDLELYIVNLRDTFPIELYDIRNQRWEPDR